MTIEDVHTTLTQQGMIYVRETTPPPIRPSPGQSIKFPKGRKNGVARRALQRTLTKDEETPKGPFVAPKQYEIRWDRDKVDQYLRNWEAKGYLKLKPEKLKWSPFLLSRNERTNKTEAAEATETSALATTSKLAATEHAETIVNGNGNTSNTIASSNIGSPSINGDDSAVQPVPDALPLFHPKQLRSSKSPRKLAAQKQRDEALARDPTESPSVTTRSLRSRSQVLSPPAPVPVETPPVVPRKRGRGRPPRAQKEAEIAEDPVVDDDEVLAAKLAQEERRQSRQLRSRVGDSPELKRTASTRAGSNRKASRKRQRVESPPEPEPDNEGSPPPAPAPAPDEPLPNGNSTSLGSEPRASPEPSGTVNEAEASHMFQERSAPSPSASEEAILSTSDPAIEVDVESVPCFEAHPSVVLMTPDTKILLEEKESDLRSEDFGTPLTSLTSQLSLPSDDADITEVNGIDEMDGDENGESIVVDRGPGRDTEEDEYVDIDAEGEEDEDAEGEPDDGGY